MRLNRKKILLFCIVIVSLLSLLTLIIFWPQDRRITTIQCTMSVLSDVTKSWDSSPSDEARSYLAPAFRKAITNLEKKGADAIPMMIAAKFEYGRDSKINITGWLYRFDWLDIDDNVRGFYLRQEGSRDIYVYLPLLKGPQDPTTAWMVAAGPVVHNTTEQSKVSESAHGSEIFVDAQVLEKKKLLIGLMLADGRKTAPVPAYFDEWKKETGEK